MTLATTGAERHRGSVLDSRHRRDTVLRLALLAASASVAGCVRYEAVEFRPQNWNLDGRNELRISSYPSWFPEETSRIPFLYKKTRTPETVYLQIHVRDLETKAGIDTDVQTVRIVSLSYQQEAEAPIVLLSDHASNFWMQGQSANTAEIRQPVKCVPDHSINVHVSLEVNGRAYSFDAETPCVVRSRIGSLLVDAFAR